MLKGFARRRPDQALRGGCFKSALVGMLGTFYVNFDAILERSNNPAVSSNADALDVGPFAHLRRRLLDVAPPGGHRTERDFAGLGCHVCREHFADLRARGCAKGG